MEDHERVMCKIMATRENRALKLGVAKLKLAELEIELEERGCSVVGSEACMRDRLIRAVIRQEGKQRAQVPWYSWDEPGAASAEVEHMEKIVPRRKRALRKRRVVEPKKVSRGTQTESSEDEIAAARRTLAARQTSAELIPVSSQMDTSTITSRPITTQSQTTVVEYPALGKAYTRGEDNLLEMTRGPRLSTSFKLPGEWEYYSAERIRKVRAPVGEETFERISVRTPYKKEIKELVPPTAAPRTLAPPRKIEMPAGPSREMDRSAGTSRVAEVPVNTAGKVESPKATPRANQPRKAEPVFSDTPARTDQEWYTPMQHLPHADSCDSERESVRVSENSAKSRFSTVSEDTRKKSNLKNLARDGKTTRQIAFENLERSLNRDTATVSSSESDRAEDNRRKSYRDALCHELSELERMAKKRAQLERSGVSDESEKRKSYREDSSTSERDRRLPKYTRRLPSFGGRKSADESDFSEKRTDDRHNKTGGVLAYNKPNPERVQEKEFKSSHNREEEKQGDDAKSRAVKLLKSWGLKFSGEEKGEDPEEFWAQLEECREGSAISDRGIMSALPCILSKRAGRWYRTIRDEITSWAELRRAFKNQFTRELDREDLLDDLRKRTQAKGEKIANYLTSIRYIVSHFVEPPSKTQVLETAWRNLLPDYRRAMGDRLIESLEELESYGRRWERQKELDRRYVPPPPADDFHLAGAGYSGTRERGKIAAIKEVDEESDMRDSAAVKEKNKAK